VPLLGGLAVATALAERAGLEARVKWPNDVLLDGRKVCGVLAELPAPGAVVLGIGLNVTTSAEELPPPAPGQAPPTSLRLAGATTTDRDTVLRAVLRALRTGLADLEGEPDQARTAYRERCATLGQQVRLELPGATAVVGRAEQVDDAGRLVVDGTAYDAGDVVHLRGA
jgi:BirA family biotin operon repressor/biotin-[acetyl-CoA-carboxylase] ligase